MICAAVAAFDSFSGDGGLRSGKRGCPVGPWYCGDAQGRCGGPGELRVDGATRALARSFVHASTLPCRPWRDWASWARAGLGRVALSSTNGVYQGVQGIKEEQKDMVGKARMERG
jgi:hypothetical protein